MLHDDEVLCIDCMQSFHDHTDFNNLNVHVISNLHADEKVKQNTELQEKSFMKIIQFNILLS